MSVDLRRMSGQDVQSRRSRRVGLTRAKVLAEALDIVDREGVRALTMRRLGTQLGVEAMTIYHYVRNKDELLDGLLEEAFDRSLPEDAWEGPWQEALRRYAHRLLATLTAHPALVPLMLGRAALTTRTMTMMEEGLGALQAAGLPLPRGLQVIHAVTGLVIGHAVAGGTSTDDQKLIRLSEEDLSAFPLLVRAVEEGSTAPTGADPFETALEAMLRGFEPTRSPSG